MLVENGVKLSLTVIDTPGFGEAVDNTECWAPILEYVEDRFDAYLEAETRVERVDIRDNRSEAIKDIFLLLTSCSPASECTPASTSSLQQATA